ncbi:MAG: hypothetical protein BGO08_10395 [Altererythrobacter sp. 66-12]|nr:MAG: hypothetical protein BGO08_10395 [Altererythrobacter sp. 66-12]
MAALATGAGGMILRQTSAGPNGKAQFAARLADRARRIAEARIAARSQGARRWRRAALLWPLFGKEP